MTPAVVGVSLYRFRRGGIYDVLDPYRKAAEVIEASDLDYTILRPAWFTNDDEVDYETTQKGEALA